jgi:ubiquinol-cytochrome c reductase iron-sulfur subunit
VSRLRNAIVSALVLVVGRRRDRRGPKPEATRIVPALPTNPVAELAALALLGLSSFSALGFILIYALGDSLPDETPLLGATIGLAFLFLAAALVVIGLKLVPTEEIAEEYPPQEHPVDQQVIAEVMDESGTRFTRARLFKLGLFGAGGTLGLALLAPAVSFGPLFHVGDFLRTPWRRGRRLVDENGRPYKATDIEKNDFYLAFPEGTSDEEKDQTAASLVVIRLDPDQLHLPSHLKGYDAHGILAYSRICTHAGCAITLYRAPLFQPDEPKPALVCPCHYSTFDPATGGTVTFGPAGRDLPLLPVYVDSGGYLRAKGNFDGPVGPSWWGVRTWKAQP